MKKLLLSIALLPSALFAQNITTVAGNGTAAYSGDSGPATDASLSTPSGVVFDPAGNMYIGDYGNNRIRKVSTSGAISTYAGTGEVGYSGDGAAATSATLSAPTNLATDAAGNLYIADYGNNVIRKVTPAGIISTVAGNNTAYFSGDGGAATAAALNHPSGVAIDTSGNLFIADYYNKRIRKVTAAGIITTIAGTGDMGSAGDGGPALVALLGDPWGVATDKKGNVYIGDASNNKVRKINVSDTITTIAGTGLAGATGDGGNATSAELNNPPGIAVDAHGNIYIADQFNQKVRMVNTDGVITTVAGTGEDGYSGDGGLATAAQISKTNALTIGPGGNLYICDDNNNRIRKIMIPPPAGIANTGQKIVWSIFPQPATDEVTMSFEGGTMHKRVQLFNNSGQLVVDKSMNDEIMKLDISTLSPGAYVVSVTANGMQVSAIIVKK